MQADAIGDYALVGAYKRGPYRPRARASRRDPAIRAQAQTYTYSIVQCIRIYVYNGRGTRAMHLSAVTSGPRLIARQSSLRLSHRETSLIYIFFFVTFFISTYSFYYLSPLLSLFQSTNDNRIIRCLSGNTHTHTHNVSRRREYIDEYLRLSLYIYTLFGTLLLFCIRVIRQPIAAIILSLSVVVLRGVITRLNRTFNSPFNRVIRWSLYIR